MSEDEKNNLKLIVKNQKDLEVISTYIQDSIVGVKNIVFLKKNRIFIMIINRFMWENLNKSTYDQNKRITPFTPNPEQKNKNGDYVMMQKDVDRIQEFRKCIECFLCQNVCHVLRDHDRKDKFVGPRFMIRLAGLDMHPLDTEDRIPKIRKSFGSGMCNITRCCTDVCPEHIQITDNGIIPLKERVVDRFYDPVLWLWRKLFQRQSA